MPAAILSGVSLSEAMFEKVLPHDLRDWHAPITGAALPENETRLLIPGAVNMDQVVVQVDVIPSERLQFSAAQAPAT